MAAWEKLLMENDPVTDLTGTAYRTLYVDSSGDVVELAHGTAGYFLQSQGAAADPIWSSASVATLDAIGDVAAITEAQGQVIFRGAAAWDALAPGTSGYALLTQGAAADPVWGAVAVLSDTVPNTIEPDDAASAGVAVTASRQDHEHAIVAAIAVSVGTALAEGSSTSFARADHVHDLGADCIDSGTLIADDVVDSEHIAADAIQAEHIDAAATDITFAQIILTPAVSGTGTTEGTLFYDSDDDHLYVYTV